MTRQDVNMDPSCATSPEVATKLEAKPAHGSNNSENTFWPPFTVIDLGFVDDNASLVLMCYGMRVAISIDHEALQDHSSANRDEVYEQYMHFRLNAADDPHLLEQFEEWAVEPCLPMLRQFSFAAKYMKELSVQEYFQPPTFTIDLLNWRGKLKASLCDDTASEAIWPFISPVSLLELQVEGLSTKDLRVYESHELRITSGRDPEAQESSAVPKAVLLAPSYESKVAFKVATDTYSFKRELGILCKLQEHLPDSHVHLPRLLGVVRESSGDVEGSIIGLVTEYIEHDMTLRYAMEDATPAERSRWMQQIDEAVKVLHALNLTWGDVKPENVLIDRKRNAWVIDFGGGFSRDWVDEMDQGTIKGDRGGIEKIKKFIRHR